MKARAREAAHAWVLGLRQWDAIGMGDENRLISVMLAFAEQEVQAAVKAERAKIVGEINESAKAHGKMKLLCSNSAELQRYAQTCIESTAEIIQCRGSKP